MKRRTMLAKAGRWLGMTMLFIGLGTWNPARGQDAVGPKASSASLRLALATEDARPVNVRVELQTNGLPRRPLRSWDGVGVGVTNLSMAGLGDGGYLAVFSAPGYAAQWRSVALNFGKADPDVVGLKLYRKRYVVLRYVFNPAGGRDFTGPEAQSGRVAVTHWGGLPFFLNDWQVWQKSKGDDLFGDTAYLEFHRFSEGFGFAAAPKGVTFDELKEAPAGAEYRWRSLKAEKGLILLCRVQADRLEGLGYGKVMVESIAETPPPGVQVIDPP